MQYRSTIKPASLSALLDFSFEKKIHIDSSHEDKGDKEMGNPEDEQQLAAPIHQQPVSSPGPYPFAESVELPTVSATTAEEKLLLPPDSLPSKVCKCQLLYVSVIDSIGV